MLARRLPSSLALLGALTIACGEPPLVDPDAGVDAGPPEGIAPPAPPVLACAVGWREVLLPEGVTVCEPWPEGGPVDCGAGEAHFPGTPGCAVVGRACPSRDFTEELPTGRRVIFISGRPGGGGSGTRDDPFHDLGDAFAAASGGEIFALGKGTHVINALFPEDTTFYGACTRDTIIEAGFADPYTGAMTSAEGATVELRDVTIRGPTPGILVSEASTFIADSIIIEGTGISALWVTVGSTFEGRDIVVRDTLGVADGFGRALTVDGGSATILRGAFERTREIAVQAVGAGASLTLEDVAIRDTGPQSTDRAFGRAVEAWEDASVTLRRVAIESSLEYGVYIGGGASATIEDAVVRGIRSRASDGEAGRGLHVQDGGDLSARRVWVEDTRELGVYGSGTGTLSLEDVVVRATRARASDGVGGRGIQVQWGVTLDATRVLVADNRDFGVFVAFDPTLARLTDVSLRGTDSDMDGLFGRGLEVMGGAHAELTRVSVEDNHDIGVHIIDSSAMATDLVVRGTRARPPTSDGGRGLSIQASTLTGTRLRILDCSEIGLYAARGAEVTVADLGIERTARQACASTTCMADGRGFGLASVENATVRVSDFHIANNALVGVFLDAAGSVDLADGEVVGHPIGVHLGEGSTLDFATAVRSVSFDGNERNVDSMFLPLPDPAIGGSADL